GRQQPLRGLRWIPPSGGRRRARGGRSRRTGLTPFILPFRGGSHMRKCIGSALLVMMLATVPALATAQRRPAARRAAPAGAQHPSFGLQIDVGTQTDFGIGGRGVFGLSSLFPGVPLDGIVSFDYYFPSHPSGTTAHFWEI